MSIGLISLTIGHSTIHTMCPHIGKEIVLSLRLNSAIVDDRRGGYTVFGYTDDAS